MPLTFKSINQGLIAFGFFNIDTDLLLLEHYFLFADDFCAYLSRLAAQSEQGSFETSWEVHSIERREDAGDLTAAIRGVNHSGFIGKVYRRFPFPRNEEDFRQKPEGYGNRETLEKMLAKYATRKKIPVRGDMKNQTVAVAEYLFAKGVFRQLVEYVWLGGYPRWRDGVRPGYVLEAKKVLEKTTGWLFRGLSLG
ncbi:MAG: hypothetical protein P8175_14510 [Deltaproteobacteria bacterium]|jgi:hypothetical protein